MLPQHVAMRAVTKSLRKSNSKAGKIYFNSCQQSVASIALGALMRQIIIAGHMWPREATHALAAERKE